MTETQQSDRRQDSNAAVACALSERDRAARGAMLARELFAGAEAREELADGYAWRFPGDAGVLAKLADFIAGERTCCTFFRFEIDVEPGLGPIWLRLRGPEGTKTFLREHFAAG
ncbi:MAG TPA: hypothetical protein VFQ80_19685 [Thermomicrobiales bacterium]|jgi:hypothetical protein|nr:hypothetical protein [Thermomicrobiales bacterium]